MKNLPKPERKVSRKEVGGDSKSRTKAFAVVLFRRAADSHETIQATFGIRSALRAREEFAERGAAASRPENAQVFRLQVRVSGGLPGGRNLLVSRESRRANDGRTAVLASPAREPGSGFLLLDILRSDQAKGAIGIRRMRRNALGAGLGARTLTEDGAESGSVYREKRLTVERAAA